jgi:drug/metabolite transporter (DMT)-like permease
VKLVYGTLALIAAALAAATGLVADRFGLTQDNRDTIALGFLIAALLETAGLFFWDRLFPGDEPTASAD